MAVVVRDPGPMARLDEVKADAGAPSVVFQRIADGERLEKIAKEWRVPKGRFVEWFSTEHADLYDAALKVRAADLALDAMDEALAATPEDVSVRKLRADVALKLASKWDRARYGETVRVEKSITVGADAGLLGAAGELLRLVSTRRTTEKLIVPDTVSITDGSTPDVALLDRGLI